MDKPTIYKEVTEMHCGLLKKYYEGYTHDDPYFMNDPEDSYKIAIIEMLISLHERVRTLEEKTSE